MVQGSRVYAFVIGGFTFSELRSVHRLSNKLGRDVMVGGTSVQTPMKFMQQVLSLSNGGDQGYAGPDSPSSTPRSATSSVTSTPKARRW